jgi:hypothetical protein
MEKWCFSMRQEMVLFLHIIQTSTVGECVCNWRRSTKQIKVQNEELSLTLSTTGPLQLRLAKAG